MKGSGISPCDVTSEVSPPPCPESAPKQLSQCWSPGIKSPIDYNAIAAPIAVAHHSLMNLWKQQENVLLFEAYRNFHSPCTELCSSFKLGSNARHLFVIPVYKQEVSPALKTNAQWGCTAVNSARAASLVVIALRCGFKVVQSDHISISGDGLAQVWTQCLSLHTWETKESFPLLNKLSYWNLNDGMRLTQTYLQWFKSLSKSCWLLIWEISLPSSVSSPGITFPAELLCVYSYTHMCIHPRWNPKEASPSLTLSEFLQTHVVPLGQAVKHNSLQLGVRATLALTTTLHLLCPPASSY